MNANVRITWIKAEPEQGREVLTAIIPNAGIDDETEEAVDMPVTDEITRTTISEVLKNMKVRGEDDV
jgi:hypothetical protein